jgi:hypothetical protein
MVLLLERNLSEDSLKKHKEQYSIKMPKKDPNSKEENLNLLVINETKLTKAHRRSTAIKNYKVWS